MFGLDFGVCEVHKHQDSGEPTPTHVELLTGLLRKLSLMDDFANTSNVSES